MIILDHQKFKQHILLAFVKSKDMACLCIMTRENQNAKQMYMK